MTLLIRNEDIEVKLANGSTAHTVARVYVQALFCPIASPMNERCVGVILWFDGELVYARQGDDHYKFSPFIPREVAIAMAKIVQEQEAKEGKVPSPVVSTDCGELPESRDYHNALLVQSACNLSGVVFDFSRIMQKICNQSTKEALGTDWKNHHPICRLFAEQIMHLTSEREYSEAFKICMDESKKSVLIDETDPA